MNTKTGGRVYYVTLLAVSGRGPTIPIDITIEEWSILPSNDLDERLKKQTGKYISVYSNPTVHRYPWSPERLELVNLLTNTYHLDSVKKAAETLLLDK